MRIWQVFASVPTLTLTMPKLTTPSIHPRCHGALEAHSTQAQVSAVVARRYARQALIEICALQWRWSVTEHFEIERDERSRPFGYRWKERAQGLSLPGLNERESLLLALAEEHLRNLMPASITKSMEAFFSQAQSNLDPLTKARREREWLTKVRVVSTTQPLLPPNVQPGVFEQVSNALYANQWLMVTYSNASGKRIKAEVMPLGLAQQGPRLYVIGRFAAITTTAAWPSTALFQPAPPASHSTGRRTSICNALLMKDALVSAVVSEYGLAFG